MSNSFSTYDYMGNEVTGTVLWEDSIEQIKIVEDDDGETLWIVDDLDDVGVSLDAKQLGKLLPLLQSWATARTPTGE